MADSFDLILTGETLPGHARDTAAAALARLMRISEERALALLGGSATVVKRGLDETQVPRYLQALGGAGVDAKVVTTTVAAAVPAPAAAPVATAADPAPGPAAPEPPPAQQTLALVEETVQCPACGAEQPKRTLCRECGADMPRMLAAQAEAARTPAEPAVSPFAAPRAGVRDLADELAPETPNALALSLRGRIGRLRYLAYCLPAYVPLIGGAVLGGVIAGLGRSPAAMILPMALGGLITLWLFIRVLVLRLHDLNRTGKWGLAALVPILGAASGSLVLTGILVLLFGLASLALVFMPGSDGANDYGPPPGENTLWTVLGAGAMVLLTIASSVTNGGRQFVPGMPGPVNAQPAAESADDR